jgi:hypothetical protein
MANRTNTVFKMTTKHKTFISYHHANDQQYRDIFEKLFANSYDIMISKSVQIGDIDTNIKTETIRQKIRDEYLRDTTVTIVLIGTQTWQRKHVDWEISSSIRQTEFNPRSGLIGIFLPTYPLNENRFDPHTIPPRLYDNWKNEKSRFAQLYNWSTNPSEVSDWIHRAFEDRNKIIPDNSYPTFSNNRTGLKWQ